MGAMREEANGGRRSDGRAHAAIPDRALRPEVVHRSIGHGP